MGKWWEYDRNIIRIWLGDVVFIRYVLCFCLTITMYYHNWLGHIANTVIYNATTSRSDSLTLKTWIYPLKMVIFHSFLYVYQKVITGVNHCEWQTPVKQHDVTIPVIYKAVQVAFTGSIFSLKTAKNLGIPKTTWYNPLDSHEPPKVFRCSVFKKTNVNVLDEFGGYRKVGQGT